MARGREERVGRVAGQARVNRWGGAGPGRGGARHRGLMRGLAWMGERKGRPGGACLGRVDGGGGREKRKGGPRFFEIRWSGRRAPGGRGARAFGGWERAGPGVGDVPSRGGGPGPGSATPPRRTSSPSNTWPSSSPGRPRAESPPPAPKNPPWGGGFFAQSLAGFFLHPIPLLAAAGPRAISPPARSPHRRAATVPSSCSCWRSRSDAPRRRTAGGSAVR